ncbi:MAG: hypothetical protein SFY80_00695 [Verrucomicrobiota bacterium]|nr:hypothetical protein [Verrucomicrobiota bacterium]
MKIKSLLSACAALLISSTAIVNAAQLKLSLINVSLPAQSWAALKTGYSTALNSYGYLWTGYAGVSFRVDLGANSIDYVWTGIEYADYKGFYDIWAGQYLSVLNQSVAAVGLRYELSYDGVALAETRIQELRQYWPNAANLGDYWSWTQGMSYFYVYYYPWIWTPDSTWYYAVPYNGGFYYWIPNRGWVWSYGSLSELYDLS